MGICAPWMYLYLGHGHVPRYGASLNKIFTAVTWSVPSTFAQFYQINVTASISLSEQVLGGAQR